MWTRIKTTFQLTLLNTESIMHAKKLVDIVLKDPAVQESAFANIYCSYMGDMFFEVDISTYYPDIAEAIKECLNENRELYAEYRIKKETVII